MRRSTAATLAARLVLAATCWLGGLAPVLAVEPETVASIDATERDGVIHVEWRVTAGHYLFANKLRVESATPGVVLGGIRTPAPETYRDPFFGDVEVLRDRFIVELDRPRASDAGDLALAISAQGCAVDGECGTFAWRIPVERAAPAPPSDPISSAPISPAPASPSVLGSIGDLLGRALREESSEEFLDPDVAFVVDTRVVDPHTVIARWRVADGYYLYRERFGFGVAGGLDATLGDARLPEGKTKEDEYFGRMEVYYHEVAATIPLASRAAQAGEIELAVRYQGCADAGLCYPPMEKTLRVALPALEGTGTGSTAAPAAPAAPPALAIVLPEQDRIAHSLATGNPWLVLLGFFGFGLLLTFTPCVLPMIPILSSIIVGQGAISTARAFSLSLTYVLAMAATYTVAGVLAGLFGANLQAAFQDPLVLGVFAALFVVLALSMFGLYDLQIPPAWQAKLSALSNRQQGGTFIGVGIMGVLSALIVGPCIAAPLAGALIYIGQSGDAVLGGLALFALGMGMGVPLLVVGTSAGKLLPRAGPWMSAVKAVFGVLLLGVAVWLIERVVPAPVALLLWGALLVVTAIFAGALDVLDAQAGGWRRLSKAAGLVAMVYGVLLIVGAAAGGGDPLRPLRGLALSGDGSSHEGLVFRRVKGLAGVRSEIAAAVAQGRPLMLDTYADWCVSCKEMERYTFSDEGVRAALAGTILIQVDVTENDAADQALLRAFGLFGPPAILFFGPDGDERRDARVVGYMEADAFRRVVERATTGASATRGAKTPRRDDGARPGSA